jgi:two-component system NarL family sensor kinase
VRAPIGLRPRMPLESREPIVAFAAIRAAIAAAALVALALLGFPDSGGATVVLAAVALPWAAAVLALTRRSTAAGLSPLVVVGDMAVLGILQGAAPDLYVPVHFAALFLVAAHAHFQGAERGLAVGVLPPLVLVPIALSTDVPVESGPLTAYEAMFAVTSVSAALVVGALRTAESSGRIRARALSRRAIDTESAARRRLAEAIHDGPLQELSSVELMLASAEQALARGDARAGRAALQEARALTRANVAFLRDEVVDLGPQAFQERSLEQAIADCVEVWERRYGFGVVVDVEADDLDPNVAGPLFQITQEAVANAGKHADASTVTVRVRRDERTLVLAVTDDGRGFGDVDPLGAAEPGHIGLASMRERAEMLGGELVIDRADALTRVRVRVPV